MAKTERAERDGRGYVLCDRYDHSCCHGFMLRSGFEVFANIWLLSVPLLSSPILYATGLHSLISHHKLSPLFLVSPAGLPQTKCKESEKAKNDQAPLIANGNPAKFRAALFLWS
jgi:hypothetical protein